MQVKILRTTVADKQFVRAGAVVDLPDFEARSLILLGKAALANLSAEPVAAVLDTAAAEPVIAKSKGRGRGAR